MKKFEDITGENVRTMRERMELSQAVFWPAIGVSQPAGHRFERGECSMSIPVRWMVFMRYVLGIDFDATPAGMRRLKRLAQLAREEVKTKTTTTKKESTCT